MPKLYTLTTLNAALLCLVAAPALARPQWLPISADEQAFLDYNSIRASGGTRSATISVPSTEEGKTDALTMHINCRSWMFAFTITDYNRDQTTRWMPIGKGTTAETAAEIMCPK